jgi:hypothetical protein
LSTHWRLAAGGAAVAGLISLLAAGTIWYHFGGTHAGAYLYGVGVGVVCFTSIAVTAALLGGRISGDRIVLGLAVYFGRLAFAAVGLGVPIYLGSLPAVPLLCGFAGVYVVENVVLLVGAPAKMAGESPAVRSGRGGVERRTGV